MTRPVRPARRTRTAALRPAFVATALLLGAAAPAASAQVGQTRLDLAGLPVTLTYPTEAVARPVAQGPFTLTVASDAALAAGAPRRLIVMSHGTGGSAVAEGTLAGRLARAGFVVAQPQHAGDNFQDTKDAGPTSWARRPQELGRVIDALAQDPRWAPRLALDKVGVHGSSAGGGTALVMAGAQWRLLDFVRHCDAHLEADWGTCMAGAATPAAQAARTERFRSVRGAPEIFLPGSLKQVQGGRTPTAAAPEVRPDPRVAAVSAAVPVAAMLSAESLARIRVPVGLVRMGSDTMVVPALHLDRVAAQCRACRVIADLPQGAHMDVMSPWPAEVARQVSAAHPRGAVVSGQVSEAQREAVFDAVVAFHREHLR